MVIRVCLRWGGDHGTVTPEAMCNADMALGDDVETCADFVRRGWVLVDACSAISAAPPSVVTRYRPVRWLPLMLLMFLRGLLSQRIGSLTCLLMTCRHLLPTKSGCKPNWLSQHVVVDDQRDETFIAVVRFDIGAGGKSAALSIYLMPDHYCRRLGLPAYMTAERALCYAHFEVVQVTSHIHTNNVTSRRLHVEMGFVVSLDPALLEWLIAIRTVQSENKHLRLLRRPSLGLPVLGVQQAGPRGVS